MAYSQYNTYSAFGVKPSINLDPMINPFTASVGVIISSGTASYGIQYSVDPLGTSDGSATWFNDATLPPGQTANGVTTYTFPVNRVRISIAQMQAGASVALNILQGFSTL